MNERPILFSGPMVRAILDGRKTQTRRVMKEQPSCYAVAEWPRCKTFNPSFDLDGSVHCANCGHGMRLTRRDATGIPCPYGKPGDRLWVRETFYDDICPRDDHDREGIYYRADGDPEFEDRTPIPWKPSIHMPRWASRITLESTEVRVQRLQDISANDCLAEGVGQTEFWTPTELNDRPFDEKWWDDFHFWSYYPQIAFRRLWESINGPGSWDANPWVWAVSFRPIPTAVSEVRA